MKKKNSVHIHTGERRRQIIDAALSCFTEVGFNETGIQNIGKRAGASVGSIYHHFKSKEQLAAAVYMDGIVQYQEGLISTLEQEENMRAGIRAIIHFHLDWVAENFHLSRFLFHRRHDDFMKFAENELAALNKDFAVRFASWLKKQILAKSIREIPPDVLSALILGPCFEYTRLYLNGASVTSVDEAKEILTAAIWKILTRKDPG